MCIDCIESHPVSLREKIKPNCSWLPIFTPLALSFRPANSRACRVSLPDAAGNQHQMHFGSASIITSSINNNIMSHVNIKQNGLF